MNYDLIVLGSGPGGYVAAIRCAQLGMKTAIIERYSTLGGTCLNVGCIPSKALLDSSEHYHNATHTFTEHGIDVKEVKVNLAQMIKRKAEVVKQTCDGINFLMKKNKITVFNGHGSFFNKNTIEIAAADGSKTQIESAKTIIATGSKPATLPGIEIDKKRIITSTEALELKEIPKHMIIIGGVALEQFTTVLGLPFSTAFDLQPGIDFELEVSTDGEDGRLRPDAVVNLPHGF